jgi:hypothetical protein
MKLLALALTRSCVYCCVDALQPAAKEGTKAPDALVLTPYEKVTATATGGFWLGLLGLGAVGVYFVARELLPKCVPDGDCPSMPSLLVTDAGGSIGCGVSAAA